jgi:hypothetical protein|tara:strand:+ start:2478 stop:2822 length:345 start_codon:yes stop_codon:yes gene_type:complete
MSDYTPNGESEAEMAAISDSTGFADSIVTLAERLLAVGVDNAVVMDGFDDCVIGILERCGTDSIVIYDKQMVIDQLIETCCDDYEDAEEFYEYNQLGSFLGDKTPGFLIRLPGT